LSNNSKFWKLEEICIPQEKYRGKGFGSDLLNYVRKQLWENQKLPIRVHAGVSPDAVLSKKTPEDTKRFYRKNGFQDERDGKHLVHYP
jgi:GNAT superfamily N-acetyltransferase